MEPEPTPVVEPAPAPAAATDAGSDDDWDDTEYEELRAKLAKKREELKKRQEQLDDLPPRVKVKGGSYGRMRR